MPWKTVPPDWQLSPELRQWTRDKGLSEADIDDQLERFRDHDYEKPKIRPDACWRTWIRNAIKWGDVHVSKAPKYYQPELITDDMRAENDRKFREQIARFTRK